MKKLQTYDKYNDEEHSRVQPRPKPRMLEAKKILKYDSFGCRREYFSDENTSAENPSHSYQMERRPRSTSQASIQLSKERAIQNRDMMRARCGINPRNEHKFLDRISKDTDLIDHPLHPNRRNVIQSKNEFSSIISGLHPLHLNRRNVIQPKNEFSSIDGAKSESFNMKGRNIKLGTNENPSKNQNLDVKNTHFGKESSLPIFQKYNTSCKSNHSPEYYDKEINDNSNSCFYDLPKNSIYTHEEKVDFQSDDNIMDNSSQKTVYLNQSDLHEDLGFSAFKLTDLLHYNTNLMQDQKLFEYASALKSKVLEKIDKFDFPEKDELEFLCEITDGDQSGKNQQIITTRTCRIVKNIIEKYPLLNFLDTPSPNETIVCQTLPNLNGTTHSSSNLKSPVIDSHQNSEISTSISDYNLTSDYNIAQNDKCIISKGISDSFDIQRSNYYKDNCDIQNFNSNNYYPINSSSIPVEYEDADEESSDSAYRPLESSEEQIPAHTFSFDEKASVFIHFDLDNLYKYDIFAMNGDRVYDYAFSMKRRVLENIHSFMEPYKGKLNFLCELTDGTQREWNQKLITERMWELITNSKNAE